MAVTSLCTHRSILHSAMELPSALYLISFARFESDYPLISLPSLLPLDSDDSVCLLPYCFQLCCRCLHLYTDQWCNPRHSIGALFSAIFEIRLCKVQDWAPLRCKLKREMVEHTLCLRIANWMSANLRNLQTAAEQKRKVLIVLPCYWLLSILPLSLWSRLLPSHALPSVALYGITLNVLCHKWPYLTAFWNQSGKLSASEESTKAILHRAI